jgi:2-polyprenyl-3-methyl-5-hydroxy-6-metoxy-1,4-benzoquinol methylase
MTKYGYVGVAEPALMAGKGVETAAARVEQAIRTLDLDSLPISEYSRRYLGDYLRDLRGVLQHHAHLLRLALAQYGDDPLPGTLVDYGGGLGILTWLAKALGIPTVLYSDIDAITCRDAAVLGERLGLVADTYIQGEIGDLVRAVKDSSRSVDVVVSFNVIEHIYDLPAFLRQVGDLGVGRMVVAHATAANGQNPWIRASLAAMQRQVELTDRVPTQEHKQRDSTRAYSALRAEIIRDRAPTLSPEKVVELACRTRGLRKEDIEAAVDAFVHSAILPALPTHPTNTCDPLTGNWAEHLLGPKQLTADLAAAGFTATAVLPGYYAGSSRPLKSAIAGCLNLLIQLARNHGLRFAPYYILTGARNPTPTS